MNYVMDELSCQRTIINSRIEAFSKLKGEDGKPRLGVKDLIPKAGVNSFKELTRETKDGHEQIFIVIYQIRCNLLHGSKLPDGSKEILSDNDIALIEWAYDTLYELINAPRN